MESFEDNPAKLRVPGSYIRSELPVTKIINLPAPKWPTVDIGQVLKLRRSDEVFHPITLQDLANWLFFCFGTQTISFDDPNRQRRFVASFGALHPHHVLLGFPDGLWIKYISERHCAGVLNVESQASEQLRSKARLHYDCPDATLVALVADYDLACNYYGHPGGLLLRDAGVLLGHAQLVAAGFGIAFRILGASGAPESVNLVGSLPFKPVATGLAWIGHRSGNQS
jgi:hypothetical protein